MYEKFRLTLFSVSIFLLIFFGIKKYHTINPNKNYNNEEKSLLSEALNKLNECFDIENKNERSINESMRLIEYCMKKYGSK